MKFYAKPVKWAGGRDNYYHKLIISSPESPKEITICEPMVGGGAFSFYEIEIKSRSITSLITIGIFCSLQGYSRTSE